MKHRSLFFLVALVIGAAIPGLSQTLVVGTCKTANHHYTTIQSAITAAPANATVLVCPGTYAEQLTITAPLTLKGISDSSRSNPTITPPAGGYLMDNVPAGAALIGVATHGNSAAVNLQGLTLNGETCSNGGTAILYSSSSGTITDVAIRPWPCDSGLVVENDDAWPVTVTARNNVIDSVPFGTAVLALSGPSSSTLNFQLKDNLILPRRFVGVGFETNGNGVYASGNIIRSPGTAVFIGDGSVLDRNFISGGGEDPAIIVEGQAAKIIGNTIDGPCCGILIDQGSSSTTVTSNKMSALSNVEVDEPTGHWGIENLSPTSTIQSNSIVSVKTGIYMECVAASVNANTIVDADDGIVGVPAASHISNNFVDVKTPQTPCP